MFFVWWLVLGIPPFAQSEAGFPAIYRAMTLLVVASPCALVLSIPSAILAAIAWGAKNGILFRGGSAVEKLASVNAVCLDKTGTLTTGDLQVVGVESYPAGREDDVASLAVTLEANSTHPIARAITAYGKHHGIAPAKVTQFQNLTGKGLKAETGDGQVLLGKRELLGGGGLAARLARYPWPAPGQTEVWIVSGQLLGRILLRDSLRPESKDVLDGAGTPGHHRLDAHRRPPGSRQGRGRGTRIATGASAGRLAPGGQGGGDQKARRRRQESRDGRRRHQRRARAWPPPSSRSPWAPAAPTPRLSRAKSS